MNDNEIRQLLTAFQNLPETSRSWPAVFLHWINRADGFIEMMTLENEPSTAQFLIEKLTQLLQDLPQNTSDAELADLVSKEFEILFFRAQFNSDFWNSTQESFRDFCRNRGLNIPNQLIIDIPHEQPERVAAWLRTFVN